MTACFQPSSKKLADDDSARNFFWPTKFIGIAGGYRRSNIHKPAWGGVISAAAALAEDARCAGRYAHAKYHAL